MKRPETPCAILFDGNQCLAGEPLWFGRAAPGIDNAAHCMRQGAITGVIDRLEKAGLVRRGHDAHDRRRVIIEPIENPVYGEEVGRVFGPLALATISDIVERYTDEELAVVLDFVRRGSDLMKEQTARLQRDKPGG